MSGLTGAVEAGGGNSALSGPPAVCVGSANPPASSAGVSPRGNSSSASGLPRVSATIRSRTRSSSRPAIAESSSARASPSLRPSTTSSGSPQTLVAAHARANTIPTRSASRRRARTQASAPRLIQPLRVIDDTPAAAPRPPPRTGSAPPARRETGPAPPPSLSPNAIPSASRCGPGSCSSRSSIGAHSCCRPGERQLHLGLHPRPPARRDILPPLDQVFQQRGLPEPRLAPQDQ